MVRNVLAPLGFDLVFADNGEACLAVCRAQLPDLVMLDITMPGRDGWDTARAIREAHGDDPMILMFSAKRSEERRVGTEWVSTVRYRWSPVPLKKKKQEVPNKQNYTT